MSRVRYTVVSIARGADEPAWRDEAARSTWALSLSDSAGKRYLLHLAQPADRPVPHVAGAVLTLDARLVSAEEKEDEKRA